MALELHKARGLVTGTLNLPVIRQKQGISLRAIADSTKISLRFLEAIEAEQFEQLPGGVYTISYLTQYASAIGMASEELLTYYRWKAGLDSAEADGNVQASQSAGKNLLRVLENFIF